MKPIDWFIKPEQTRLQRRQRWWRRRRNWKGDVTKTTNHSSYSLRHHNRRWCRGRWGRRCSLWRRGYSNTLGSPQQQNWSSAVDSDWLCSLVKERVRAASLSLFQQKSDPILTGNYWTVRRNPNQAPVKTFLKIITHRNHLSLFTYFIFH